MDRIWWALGLAVIITFFTASGPIAGIIGQFVGIFLILYAIMWVFGRGSRKKGNSTDDKRS
jgi:hypothetical protein